MRRVGVLIPFSETDAEAQAQVAAFRIALQQLGWVDGRNLRFDIRWADGDVGRMRTFAKELVGLQPDAILARTTPVTATLFAETRTIPIVFVGASDPVGDGLVASIARPGGNVTGFTNVEASLGGKWLEILKEIVPQVARVGVIFNPKTSPGRGSFYLRAVEEASRSMGVEVTSRPIQDAGEIERAVEALGTSDCDPRGVLARSSVRLIIVSNKKIKLRRKTHEVDGSPCFRTERAPARDRELCPNPDGAGRISEPPGQGGRRLRRRRADRRDRALHRAETFAVHGTRASMSKTSPPPAELWAPRMSRIHRPTATRSCS